MTYNISTGDQQIYTIPSSTGVDSAANVYSTPASSIPSAPTSVYSTPANPVVYSTTSESSTTAYKAPQVDVPSGVYSASVQVTEVPATQPTLVQPISVQPITGTSVQPLGTPGQPMMGTPGQPMMGTPGQPMMGTPGQPVMGSPDVVVLTSDPTGMQSVITQPGPQYLPQAPSNVIYGTETTVKLGSSFVFFSVFDLDQQQRSAVIVVEICQQSLIQLLRCRSFHYELFVVLC